MPLKYRYGRYEGLAFLSVYIMMSIHKKRLIKEWKQYGTLTMYYIEYYKRMKLTTDLASACRFYIRCMDIKYLIWEHNI